MTAILADNCRPESESKLWTCKTAPQSICGTTPCPATPQPSYLCPSAVRAGGWEQWNDTEINQIAEYRPARHRTCIILIQLQWWWNHWSLRTPPCHHYCICCLLLSSSPLLKLICCPSCGLSILAGRGMMNIIRFILTLQGLRKHLVKLKDRYNRQNSLY